MSIEQIRTGLQQTIRKEGIRVAYKYRPMIDNGYGEMIPDLSEVEIESQIWGRIALERRGPVTDGSTPAGLSTNLSRFIITDWKTPVMQEGIISGLERDYRIAAVTPLIKFGNIYGYQASLIEG